MIILYTKVPVRNFHAYKIAARPQINIKIHEYPRRFRIFITKKEMS